MATSKKPAAKKPAARAAKGAAKAAARPAARPTAAKKVVAKRAAPAPAAAPSARPAKKASGGNRPAPGAKVSGAVNFSPASTPQKLTNTALPRRLFLLLDGRGIDGFGMPFEVIDLPCSIGSGRRNTLWINSPQVETEHAQIVETDEGWVYEDLGSEHGTFLDGERIERHVLAHGDLFKLADYLRIRVEMR